MENADQTQAKVRAEAWPLYLAPPKSASNFPASTGNGNTILFTVTRRPLCRAGPLLMLSDWRYYNFVERLADRDGDGGRANGKSDGRPEVIYRHSGMVRVTHWINALVLLVLLMSGLQIFNAHPALYLGQVRELAKRRDNYARCIRINLGVLHHLDDIG